MLLPRPTNIKIRFMKNEDFIERRKNVFILHFGKVHVGA